VKTEDRAHTEGLSVASSAHRRNDMMAMKAQLESRQRDFTRRVESYLRRAAKVTPEQENARTFRRCANALELIVSLLYRRVRFSPPWYYDVLTTCRRKRKSLTSTTSLMRMTKSPCKLSLLMMRGMRMMLLMRRA
jgi:hypothetical protein